jgi:hypothetical protein
VPHREKSASGGDLGEDALPSHSTKLSKNDSKSLVMSERFMASSAAPLDADFSRVSRSDGKPGRLFFGYFLFGEAKESNSMKQLSSV